MESYRFFGVTASGVVFSDRSLDCADDAEAREMAVSLRQANSGIEVWDVAAFARSPASRFRAKRRIRRSPTREICAYPYAAAAIAARMLRAMLWVSLAFVQGASGWEILSSCPLRRSLWQSQNIETAFSVP